MITVKLNGDESHLKVKGLDKIWEIVELVKGSIDPEHMITGILINGRELEDNEWHYETSQFGTAILEVETGTPESFIQDRISRASSIVNACFNQFRDARKSFQSGDTQQGNQMLVTAVGTLKAFFEWYTTLGELMPAEQSSKFDLSEKAEGLAEVCKQITQLQMYQSWWALGETIKDKLEPKLDELEDFCRNLGKNYQGGN
jgi:hypothetical protein